MSYPIPATNSSTPSLTTWESAKNYLNQVDWKTHALVVLGYLLVGLGIALACSSFYIAFVAHPMIAMAPPTLAIATIIAGVWTLNSTKSNQSTTDAAQVDPRGPMGLKNFGNDCWLISALQMFFHIEAFKKLIKEATANERSKMGPLLYAFDCYQKGQSVDVKKVRNWLKTTGIDDEINSEEDSCHAINHILQLFKRETFPEIQVECYKTTQLDFLSSFITSPKRKTMNADSVNLAFTTPLVVQPQGSLQTAINSLFYVKETISDYGKKKKTIERETIVSLKSPPPDLSFEIVRADPQAPIQPDMVITLDATKIGENTTFVCDGFVVALPGHYISCFCEGGKWWEANDDTTKELTLDRVKEHLKKATFVHYAKAHSDQLQPSKLLNESPDQA